MKKIIISIISFILLSTSVLAVWTWYYDNTISVSQNKQTVKVWANKIIVFSLDKQIKDVSFSTDSLFTIRTLEWWNWIDMTNNPSDYTPLKWYMVQNHNSFDLNITFTFKDVSEVNKTIFQKTLKAGWNLVWPAYKNDIDKKVGILDFLWNSNFSHLLDLTWDSLVYSWENQILTKKTYSWEVPIQNNTAITHEVNWNSQILNSSELNNIKVIEWIAYWIFVPNDTVIPWSQNKYVYSGENQICDEVSQLLGLCWEQYNYYIESANALAQKWIINNNSTNTDNYFVNNNIDRWEIAILVRWLAWLSKVDCTNIFSDVNSSLTVDNSIFNFQDTFVCNSVEALVNNWIIAQNAQYYPNSFLTRAEAVWMVVKAIYWDNYIFNSNSNDSWQKQVVDFAASKWLLANFTTYDVNATRWFVFWLANEALNQNITTNTCDEVSQLLGLCNTFTLKWIVWGKESFLINDWVKAILYNAEINIGSGSGITINSIKFTWDQWLENIIDTIVLKPDFPTYSGQSFNGIYNNSKFEFNNLGIDIPANTTWFKFKVEAILKKWTFNMTNTSVDFRIASDNDINIVKYNTNISLSSDKINIDNTTNKLFTFTNIINNCDEVLESLWFCTSFTSNEVNCTSNQVFSNNSCNKCYTKTWNSFNSSTFTWNNNTNNKQIIYKEEQILPTMINLLPNQISWSSPIWDYSDSFNFLYDITEEGYVLNIWNSTDFIQSNSWYTINDNTLTWWLEIWLLKSEISTHTINTDWTITIDSSINKNCTLIISKDNSNTTNTWSTNTWTTLQAPTNLQVSNIWTWSIDLTWDTASGTYMSYILYGTWSNNYTNHSDFAESWTVNITNLLPWTKYYFSAISIDELGNESSSWSTEITATTTSIIWTLSTSTLNPQSQLLLAGSNNQNLLVFNVSAQNDSVKLNKLVFNGTNLDGLNNFKIVDSSWTTVMNSPTSITATSVIFNNSNVSDIINQDTTKTYYLTADVNLNTSKTNVSVSLDQTNSKVQSNNGVILDITPSTSAITSNIHRIEENNAIIAKTTNTSKDLNISAVRFSISAIGKNQAIISNITIKTNLTGYTGATDISIYKDTISNINLVWSGTISSVWTLIQTTSNNIINSGSTNNYIIVVNWAVIDSTANTSDWSVIIEDITYNLGTTDITASTYNNMGSFPITEVK